MRISAQAEKNQQRQTAPPDFTWQAKPRPFLAANRLGATAQSNRQEITGNRPQSPKAMQLKERIDPISSRPSVLPREPLADSADSNSLEPQQSSLFGSINNSPRLVAQRQPMVQFLGTAAPKTVQRVKATKLEGMPKLVTDAIDFLNYCEDMPSLGESIVAIASAQVQVLETSAFAEHCAGLIETIKAKIPQQLPVEPEPTELTGRYIHGIWVEGDYSQNEELTEAIKTRKGSKAATWSNLIWVYQSAKKIEPGLDGIVCRPIELHGFEMQEVDFRATMEAWEDRPEWVSRFLPLLEILLSKKSYITMSDIMRMIILYYKGGLYQDVKIHLQTPEAKFFDQPLVNADKLQLVSGGSNKENWAMVAEAGCQMIEQIMEATLEQFPSAEELERLPENYSQGGKYSSAHSTLHENLGPWNRTERLGGKTESIEDVNPSLKLKNPRPVNSWADSDQFDFNWNRPSPWREMASNILQLPPARGRMSPQHVLLELARSPAYNDSAPDFWAAYDRYRGDNPRFTYILSPVQVINRLNGASPTRLYIMDSDDWDRYEQFKNEHLEFDYD